jgi:hypothetical protein
LALLVPQRPPASGMRAVLTASPVRPMPAAARPPCRHVRLWTDFEAALQSGCSGDACPCLNGPASNGDYCMRIGDRLADLPRGWSDYTMRCARRDTHSGQAGTGLNGTPSLAAAQMLSRWCVLPAAVHAGRVPNAGRDGRGLCGLGRATRINNARAFSPSTPHPRCAGRSRPTTAPPPRAAPTPTMPPPSRWARPTRRAPGSAAPRGPWGSRPTLWASSSPTCTSWPPRRPPRRLDARAPARAARGLAQGRQTRRLRHGHGLVARRPSPLGKRVNRLLATRRLPESGRFGPSSIPSRPPCGHRSQRARWHAWVPAQLWARLPRIGVRGRRGRVLSSVATSLPILAGWFCKTLLRNSA